MRTIQKGSEPQSLVQHRAAQHGTYENFSSKEDLRKALVRDQGAICCYCMGRIKPTEAKMKIEHFKCQKNHPDLALIYSNLFGACNGNEGENKKFQHCDTKKADLDFCKELVNTPYRLEDLIKYEADGRISSEDQALDKDLNEVLNLNYGLLKENRKNTLAAFLSVFQSKNFKDKTAKKATLERWLADWKGEQSPNSELRPYCQVVIYWLEKRLKRE